MKLQPIKDTYLWTLTVLEAIAAGVAADRLMTYLSAWEEHCKEILDKFRVTSIRCRLRGSCSIYLSLCERPVL